MSASEQSFTAVNSGKAVTKSRLMMAYIVCGLAALFYLYEYILQVCPSVMTDNLMRDLNIDSVGLGIMAAFYFYAYSPMQLPAGLLYDRFGPRRMITIALLICALGAFFFGMTPNLALASAGRFFMGIGSAFSFIGALVLIARWFPAKYFALLAGVTQLMSSVGAMIGEVPISHLVEGLGWRNVMVWLGGIGVLLAVFIWSIVRDYPKETTPEKLTHYREQHEGELKKLGTIARNPQTWVIAIYSFAIWAPIAVFGTLWDVPYLKALYNIDAKTASVMASMVWLGIGVGSPLLGWWSDYIRRRCMPLSVSAGIGIISALIILYVPNISIPMMYVLMFFFGLAASGQATSFGVVKDINKSSVVGTAVGLNNMAVLLGGVVFQPLVGQLLQYFWDGKIVDNVHVYSAANFQQALFLLPACFALAFIMSSFFLKETHCEAQHP